MSGLSRPEFEDLGRSYSLWTTAFIVWGALSGIDRSGVAFFMVSRCIGSMSPSCSAEGGSHQATMRHHEVGAAWRPRGQLARLTAQDHTMAPRPTRLTPTATHVSSLWSGAGFCTAAGGRAVDYVATDALGQAWPRLAAPRPSRTSIGAIQDSARPLTLAASLGARPRNAVEDDLVDDVARLDDRGSESE